MCKLSREDYKKNYIDEIFSYTSLWDMPAKCGLKIITKSNKTIVIVTELYHDNPGSSITEYCAELANIIAGKNSIKPNKLLFIQHNPDLGSKYAFLTESFYLVSFDLKNNAFGNPQWKKISKESVNKMINE